PAGRGVRRVARLADLGELRGGAAVPVPVLRAATRWTPLVSHAAPAAGSAAAGAGAESAGTAGAAAGAARFTGAAEFIETAGLARSARVTGAVEVAGAAGAAAGGARASRRGSLPAGHVELGELCRVHRGQVTGANKVWVTSGNPAGLPGRFLFPAVTRASELFR